MTYIHPTAIVHRNVILGENVYIGAHSVIGGPPEHKDFWGKEYGTVIIGNNVRISNLVTIDAGTTGATFIDQGCILLAHSHVGHDAQLSEGVTVSCGAKVGGHAIIGKGSNIGLNAVIHQRVMVPERCMIGMGAVVNKSTDMDPASVYVGNPARYLRSNTKAEAFSIPTNVPIPDHQWTSEEMKEFARNVVAAWKMRIYRTVDEHFDGFVWRKNMEKKNVQ